MYTVRPPKLAARIYSDLIWSVPTDKNTAYLTFDDGPIPEVTPWVLDTLKEHNAKATFFCLGKNVELNPEIYQRIKQEGHATGNHTWDHIDGWKATTESYLENIHQCAELVDATFFRPPYGRIRHKQIKALRDRFRIIMWDTLSGDFDQTISPEKCLKNVLKYARPGSIIVFHDSLKAKKNLQYALPRFLKEFNDKGFHFNPLEI